MQLSIPKLQDFLKSAGHAPIFQEETNQLILIHKIDKTDFPIFFRIFEGGELLQLISFVPCNLKRSSAADLARLLHLINKEIDFPGFGMDEKAGIIYLRLMLVAPDQQIEEKSIALTLRSIKNSCETFGPVISAVAAGAASYDEVLKKLAQG